MNQCALTMRARNELVACGLSDWDITLLSALIVECTSEKEIAGRLGRSAPAVRKRFQVIRKKLGARNQLELAMMIGAMCARERTEGKK